MHENWWLESGSGTLPISLSIGHGKSSPLRRRRRTTVADKEQVSRKTIESRARAYLERSRSVRSPQTHQSFMVKGSDFEAIVKREVDQTIRQLRGMGKKVVD